MQPLARIASAPNAREKKKVSSVGCLRNSSALEFGLGRIRERASVLEHVLIVKVLQREALHGLAVRDRGGPAGREDGVDGVNDAVLADDVGGVGRPAGVVVELADEGRVDVQLPELVLAGEGVAAEGFEGSREFVGVQVLRDDVGFDH
eukprot:CAMPEP_0197723638 /NCGR_PEP_ID=MMETSP1434-20131217/5875_1 /TAXON_ID=265543 /ORGANISM="Minutocellus polymorphus, Strain CCMP3303" /LENGTH=147 /DNA_ID=CAMNT_0043308919 /DNA_START=119 /DNA_END=559 /DNA_ORIENTATION=-